MQLIKQINERANTEVLTSAQVVVDHIVDALPVVEMRNNRGQHFPTTHYYQIRVKPAEKGDMELVEVIDMIEKRLKDSSSKALGISSVQVNERSVNSSKFSSVSFMLNGADFDVVVALGGNAGEKFEKQLLLKMDEYIIAFSDDKHHTVADSDQALAAFKALEKVDPAFELSNIASVSPRTGSTQRSSNLTPEETGAIIADIVVHLKSGGKKYISVKNANGSTVAQFGLSKAFNDDLSVNTDSSEWHTWLAPFGLDAAKLQEGLLAAKNKTELEWSDIDKTVTSINHKHPVFKIMQQLWGSNYYYLREQRGGFYALRIDRDYVDKVVLADLKVTEIRYPSINRKQITISLESSTSKFKIEVRNPRGKGSFKPTQIQLSVGTSVK